MSKAAMVMNKSGYRFVYKGGEYIEVQSPESGAIALDVINVFDYEAGKSKVQSLEDFEVRVFGYINEMGE